MKKLLKIATLISILLFSTSAYAMTRQEFTNHHEFAIEEMCESKWIEIEQQKIFDIYDLIRFPSRYECGITQFYALTKVIDIIMYVQPLGHDSEEGRFFQELMERHAVNEHATFDFVSVHIDWEEFMESR